MNERKYNTFNFNSPVYPRIPHPVRELLFLPPKNLTRKIRLKINKLIFKYIVQILIVLTFPPGAQSNAFRNIY